MGVTKIEEIRALFSIERVGKDFREKYGRDYTEEDVQECYKRFQKVLFDTLEDYTEPIPGVVEVIAKLRAQGIKIGSTTGYTQKILPQKRKVTGLIIVSLRTICPVVVRSLI